MTLTRKIVLRDAPPLVGTEIAVYIDGKSTELTDGYTFGMMRVTLANELDKFIVEWGDGNTETIYETVSGLTHTYSRPGVYRIRISDDISDIMISTGGASVFPTVYAPMVREFRTNSTRIQTIARTAFRNAVNLHSLELRGSAIRTLSSSAFAGCVSLTSLMGCSEIETLYLSVFNGCTGLSGRIDMPNLTNITTDYLSYSPFLNTNITEFHFAAKNEEAIRSLSLFYDTDGNLGVEGAVSFFDL